MEKETLLIAVQQLTTQKTPDGIQKVLQRYPELLTENTILTLLDMATQTTTKDPESSRFFDEVATWLQGLTEGLTASAVTNNPTIEVVKQVLAGTIELDAALERLRSDEVSRHYGDEVLTMLDNLAWSFREKERPDEALIVARLNFEAARSTTSELKKYSGITLLQNMPTTAYFAGLRAYVCEVTANWLTPETDPELWAGLIVEYGNALLEIATGDKEENIERAIQCYEAAVETRTRAAVPHEWATTILNLGSAYVRRRRGDPQENQERAIEIYQQSLQILTRETTPNEWATAMNALAVVYLERFRGDKDDNIEQAINFLESCMQVHTFEDFPTQWAMVHDNLGIAYLQRPRGDTTENKELSIQHHETALRVYTAEKFPVDWARTNHNLGITFTYRLRGEPLRNLEQAKACFNSALQI